MKTSSFLLSLGSVLIATSTGLAASSGPRFYGEAPDDHHPWAVHDGNRPEPKRVTPGTFSSPEQAGKPPSDAIILFDGTDLSKWQTDKGEPVKWLVKDGYMQVTPGSGQIRTRQEFSDCQLHIEWAAPAKVEGSSQGRANSGVFLMGRLEIQVLDSFNNETYADGHAGAYYGINPPMALPIRGPGEWQMYDIVFRRPIYKDGQVLDPGYVTVFVNGVLVQDHTPLEGSGGHMGRTKPGPFPEKGPLALQDHGNPMRFRNVWYRELPKRAVEGGTDGWLTTEATKAKRAETAAMIRADAAKLQGNDKMFRLYESMVYENDTAAAGEATRLAEAYVASLKALPATELAAKRDEVRNLRDVYRYLAKSKVVADNYGPKTTVDQMIRDQGFDKKK